MSSWGGERKGAGAKLKYHEPTTVMRLPKSTVPYIKALLSAKRSNLELKTPDLTPLSLPLMVSRVSAGFPSPADDYMETRLDINDYLIKHPTATFYARLGKNADSMINAGIFPGDIIVVDRSLEVKHGHIVLAVVNGEFTLKRYHQINGKILLNAENPAYDPIEFTEGDEMQIWGVVKNSIRDL